MVNDSLGSRIKKSRESRDITQDKLSGDLNISRRTLIEYEKDASEPTVSRALEIAKYLKVDPIWLIIGEEEKHLVKENIQIYGIRDVQLHELESENEHLKERRFRWWG